MASKKIFLKAFILLALITSVFLVGEKLYLSSVYWWFDMVLHFSSGVCVAMGGISVWYYFFPKTFTNKSKVLWVGMSWVLLVGITWELFELYFGLVFLSDGIHYVTDTSSDLIMDVLGGFLGALYSHKILNKNGER